MSKLLSKSANILVGVLAGAISARLFKPVWQRITGEDKPPPPTSDEYGWAEVLAAAALYGAILATVKAVINRGSVRGARRVAGRPEMRTT